MPVWLLVVVDVVLIFVVARALRPGLERVKQPAVMAEVLAGLVLGASVLGAVSGGWDEALFTAEAREWLGRLGNVAIVAYVFVVGAELDTTAIRRERRVVGTVAIVSFAVPWLAGAALALALHGSVATDPPKAAFVVFLGTALAVTAFPVLARIVGARGLDATRAGRTALGAAAAQEVLVWPLLAVAVAMAVGAGGGGEAAGEVALKSAVALAAVIVLARVVPARGRGWLVIAGLAAAASATDAAGLHLVLGAFLYGAALRPAAKDAGLALVKGPAGAALTAVLLPVFFALPATRVDVGGLGADGLLTLAAVIATAAAAKLASATAAAKAAGLTRTDAMTVGTLMNARGLVELVVLTVGLQAGLTDERLFTIMVLMALATTFATGPLVDRIRRRAAYPDQVGLTPTPGRSAPKSAGMSSR